MPSIGIITLNDGQTTPVAHSFAPADIKQGVAFYADRVTGVPLGYPQLSLSLTPPKGPRTMDSKGRNYKFVAKLIVPTLELTAPSTATGIQPAPTKAFDHVCMIEMRLPERGTLVQRNDVYAYAQNLFANPNIKLMVQNFEQMY